MFYWEPFARYSAPCRRASRTAAPADPTPRPGTRPDRGPITVHSQPCLPLARRIWKMRPVACQATTTRKPMKLLRALRDNERISDLMGGGRMEIAKPQSGVAGLLLLLSPWSDVAITAIAPPTTTAPTPKAIPGVTSEADVAAAAPAPTAGRPAAAWQGATSVTLKTFYAATV